MTRRGALLVCAAVLGGAVLATGMPVASAKPAPEVEYTYDVLVRRHFDFPGNDALGYGYRICDDVTRGVPYAALLGRVKADVSPNDEQSANYVVSNAVDILCPAQLWALRNSAAGYRPPPG